MLFSAIEDVSYYTEEGCDVEGKATCSVKVSEGKGFAPKNGANKEGRCFFGEYAP